MRILRQYFAKSLLVVALISGPLAADAREPAFAGRDARLSELNAALREINQGSNLSFELGRIEMWAPMTGFARAYGDRIEVSPLALDLFHDRAGARAVAAFLAAYVGMAHPARYAGRGPGIAETVAALGAITAGAAIDSDNSQRWDGFDWHDNRRGAVEIDELRGVRMLALLEKAHGCSGPLVEMLAKASAAKDRDSATAELMFLARRAARDLGKSVYPPDYSCVASS